MWLYSKWMTGPTVQSCPSAERAPARARWNGNTPSGKRALDTKVATEEDYIYIRLSRQHPLSALGLSELSLYTNSYGSRSEQNIHSVRRH
eukprot:3874641-Heterocapsa_arctica.AAC.1